VRVVDIARGIFINRPQVGVDVELRLLFDDELHHLPRAAQEAFRLMSEDGHERYAV
jgi:hypothetical protein